MFDRLKEDIDCVFERDPAARNTLEVVTAYPDEVARYGEGERRLLGFLVGQVMRRSGGKADPRQVNEALRTKLDG